MRPIVGCEVKNTPARDVYTEFYTCDTVFEPIVAALRDGLGVPVGVVWLWDETREWLKADEEPQERKSDLEVVLRRIVRDSQAVLIVEDMRNDPRFSDCAPAGDPQIRFCAAAPIVSQAGEGQGVLCALGYGTRKVSARERRSLVNLAKLAGVLIESHETMATAQRAVEAAAAKRREMSLKKHLLKQTEKITGVGGWRLDLKTNAVEWTDETYRIYELQAGAPITLEVVIAAFPVYERDRLQSLIAGLVEDGEAYDAEFDFIAVSGVFKRVRAMGTREENEGPAAAIFGAFQDVTESHLLKRRLWRAANHDILTGLANRNRFDELLMFGTEESAGAMLAIDADHLKEINDTLGHSAGDDLLRFIARNLCESAGDQLTVARVGGDEFAILVPAPATPAALKQLADKIVGGMKLPTSFAGAYLKPTVSIGAAIRAKGQDSEALRQAADLALYHAKANRRGDFVLYREEMKAAVTAKAFAVKTVDEALEQDLVHAFYQPTIDLSTGKISAFEALARVRHGGVDCSIGMFAEALHDRRTATRITARIMKCIEQDVLAWRKAGLKPPRIAVNVGPPDFHEGGIEALILRTCENAGIEPSMFAVEVTESVFISRNADIVSETAARLRARGIVVALDDFGTGHASLAHLGTFPVDVIKMDSTFVQRMSDGGSGAAVAESLIALAHKLGVQVIAEGVETEAQLQRLIENRCDKVQGYLFCRPLSPRDIVHLLSGRKTGSLLRSTLISGSRSYQTYQRQEFVA